MMARAKVITMRTGLVSSQRTTCLILRKNSNERRQKREVAPWSLVPVTHMAAGGEGLL